MAITPSQFTLLSKLLEGASLRHRVIANNVANVNTPGYRRLEVSFEDQLAQQLHSGRAEALAPVEPQVVETAGGPERADGNNIDIDLEMGELNKNTLLYNAYVQILASKMATMKSAITGR
jgi:flagellar basal-body rod protein FlgB